MVDGMIDQHDAGHPSISTRTAPTEAVHVLAARELVHDAAYGSLVMWGGWVVHGLRFATVAAPTAAGPASAGPTATGPTPAGPEATGPADAVPTGSESLDLFGAGGAPARIVLLAPASVGRVLGDQDQACRFQMCGPVRSDGCDWVSVVFGGWVAPVAGRSVPDLALHLADRHPTGDLFELGGSWVLLDIELAEATIRTRGGCVQLDTDDAVNLLAEPSGAGL
ncbi:conserved hypothetical protein [Frankia sp. Hr75.2]|nr:conserved hypothetical protein [Frankia sp. Hr75.2]